MIDLPVTLTPSGGVVLPGHASALALGYTKNRGVYRLSVTASGEWEGLTIRAFWHVPGGSDPASSLVVDGLVGVPSSGDPSPDNIRPIKGRDSVKVERCGGNVIEFLRTNDSHESVKIAVDAEKNITLNGALTRGANIIIGMCRLHWVAGKTYTMYVKKVGGSASLGSGDGITFAYSLFTQDYNRYFRGDTRSTNLNAYIASDAALAETELVFMLQCWRANTVFNNFKFQIEVVPGTTAPTTYAPYTGQTATITLPRTIYGGTVDAVIRKNSSLMTEPMERNTLVQLFYKFQM